MSADNGTILEKKSKSKFIVRDYNASTGDTYNELSFANLDKAMLEAQSRWTEYGITLIGFDRETDEG